MFQLPSFRFTPQEQQEPQVIDPRAAYEQRSVLADTLLRNSQQYQGGGAIGALAMIANAFAAKKMGERAQGSLSAALEQEAERERQAAEAERAAAEQEYQRELELLRIKAQMEAENRAPPAVIQYADDMNLQGAERAAYIRSATASSTGPTVNVNSGPQGPQVGTIPQGFQLAQDAETGAYRMEPIPGGPADRDIAAEEAGRQGMQEAQERYMGTVTQDIDRALSMIEQNPDQTTGVGAFATRWFPGSKADDVQGLLETIKTGVALDRLETMRENSPTGGAVGQFTEGERQAFERTLGDLEQTRSDEFVSYNLRRLKNNVLDMVHGTPEQRAELVRQGKIDPRVNEEINSLYVPVGEPPESRNQSPQQQGGQPAEGDTMSEFERRAARYRGGQ